MDTKIVSNKEVLLGNILRTLIEGNFIGFAYLKSRLLSILKSSLFDLIIFLMNIMN